VTVRRDIDGAVIEGNDRRKVVILVKAVERERREAGWYPGAGLWWL